MSYFLEENGKQTGPVSQFQILSKIEDGRLTAQNLAWRPGMDRWRPLGEFEEFHPGFSTRQLHEASAKEPLPEQEQPPAEDQALLQPGENEPAEFRPVADSPSSSRAQIPDQACSDTLAGDPDKVRPQFLMKQAWARFAARFLDMFWMNFVFGMILFTASQNHAQWIASHIQTIGLFMLFFAALMEAFLLSLWGTTPGKAMMNLRIVTLDGEKPRWQLLLSRSLLVWLIGLAMGLPPMLTIAMLMHYFWYMREGITVWDRMLNTTVIHHPIPVWRLMVVVAIFLIVAFVYLSMSKEIMQFARGLSSE